jgi:hypothetical protein
MESFMEKDFVIMEIQSMKAGFKMVKINVNGTRYYPDGDYE